MYNDGYRGEMIALQYLAAKGFTPVAQNYRCRWGEIDLIMRDGEYIVFTEVKLRKSAAFGSPLEAVTPAKRRKLCLAAGLWLSENRTELLPRFDVVGITAPGGPKERLSVEHIENAF